ncbi:MAG TPA: PKD domain-containing protein, partial [Vicinamibacteria bacterium]
MRRLRHVLGAIVLAGVGTLSWPSIAAAQSCGELGGDYCSQSGSCPAGYDSLGPSNDCSPCCVQEQQPPPAGPSCGQMGGDYCSQSGSCPAGYHSLGPSNDCSPCCVQNQQPPPAPSCGQMGGDYCSQTGSCPAGYDSLGPSNDCSPCCLQQPPAGPSCGELGGDYCSQTGSCPAGYDSLGFSNDCGPCCLQQAPTGPSCGELGGDYCSQTGSCPAGYDSLGGSNDCSPCCHQQGLTVQIDAPTEAASGEAISFRAIVTTNPGERILDYEWDFGDGDVSSESAPVHVYGVESIYLVSLGVTTDRDYITVSRTIVVRPQVEGSENFRLGCWPACEATADFRFDSTLNRLVPTARFVIERGAFDHFYKYHPVVRA